MTSIFKAAGAALNIEDLLQALLLEIQQLNQTLRLIQEDLYSMIPEDSEPESTPEPEQPKNETSAT